MNAYVKRRDQLATMRIARREMSLALEAVQRRIKEDALTWVQDNVDHPHAFGGQSPGNTKWRAMDQQAYETRLEIETEIRVPELWAIRRKLRRQEAAIAAFMRKHGFNEAEAA